MKKFVPFFLICIMVLPFVSAGMLDFLVEQKVIMIPFYPKNAEFDSINVSDLNVGDFNAWGDINFFSSVGIDGDLYVDGNIFFNGDINLTGNFDVNGVILGMDSNFINVGVTEGIYANRYYGTGDWNVVGAQGSCYYDVSTASFACGGVGMAASGAKSVAFGQMSQALNAYSGVLYGFGSIASGDNAVAGGNGCEATQNYAIAFGDNCSANGQASVSLGNVNTAGGNFSTAIGNVCTANGIGSVALGQVNGAYGNYSVALGNNSRAYGETSVAIGDHIDCYVGGQVCVGDLNVLGDLNAANMTISGVTFADGGINVTGDSNFANVGAVGVYASGTVMAKKLTCPTCITSGDYSNAIGYFSTAGGLVSTAMGANTTASGAYSTAMGDNTTASGNYSTTMGYQTTASGDYGTATGYYTNVSGDYGTAMGDHSIASGQVSIAMGYYTTASGNNSTAMGLYTKAIGNNSVAMGESIHCYGTNEVCMKDLNVSGDANFANIGISGFYFGDGSKLTGISAGSTDTTLDTNTAASDSWLGKAHSFTADTNFANIGVNENIWLDGNLYSSIGNMHIVNPTSDSDIKFEINDGGTRKEFMTIDSDVSSLKIDTGTITISDIYGIIDVKGTLTNNAIVASSMYFHPTIADTGSGFGMFYLKPDWTQTDGGQLLGQWVDFDTPSEQTSGTASLIGYQAQIGAGAGNYAQNIKGYSCEIGTIFKSGATTSNLYGAYLDVGQTATMVAGATINKYGLYIKNAANNFPIAGTINAYSIYSDGGNVELTDGDLSTTGNINIGKVNATGTGTFNGLTNYNTNSVLVNDLNADGNSFSQTILGTAWYNNLAGMSLNFATANTWYKFNMTTNNRLNGFHLVDGNFQAEVDGLYRIDYTAEGAGANNHIYVTSILVNDVNQDNCNSYETMSAGGDITPMDAFCYLDLQAGDYVTLGVLDWSGTETGTVYNYDVAIERHGKYGLGN